jgi:hypothetical protein
MERDMSAPGVGTARAGTPVAPLVPKAQGLNCPSCGAAIEMRSHGWAVTVVCGSCGAQLDATDPLLRILQHGERVEGRRAIPLGTRGTWKGHPWEAIGWQRVEILVEGTRYAWEEYVCFNPYRGFLYLSEYEGHWNVIEKQRRRPEIQSGGVHPTVTLGGTTFKHFQTATAYTVQALGEFPWELRVGDHVVAMDYVAPPLLLSAEAAGQEVTWSLGTYTPPDVIRKAFGLQRLRAPTGVFANQPNPYSALPKAIFGRFGVAMLLLIGMFLVNIAIAGNTPVFSQRFSYSRPSLRPTMDDAAFRAASEPVGEAVVTAPFTLDGRPSGVSIELSAPLENDWMYVGLVLINEATGESREVGRQLSFYSGTDSEGSWSEGSRREKVRLSAVPAGRYFLRVQAEGGEPGRGPVSYQLAVRRDEPYYLLYGFAVLALLLPTLASLVPAASFESRRWAESDHAPGVSADDDE